MSIITGIGHKDNSKGILYIEVPRWLEVFKEKKYIKKFSRNKNNPGEIVKCFFSCFS